QGTVTVNGGSGNDKLTAIDFGSSTFHVYGVTATQVTRDFGEVTINYGGIENLEAIRSPAPFPPFTFPPLAKNLKLPSSIKAGSSATLTGHLADANGDKKLTLTVDWGDGSQPVVTKPGQKPFRVHHKFTQPGTYTVRVIWTDSTGVSNFQELHLTVKSPK